MMLPIEQPEPEKRKSAVYAGLLQVSFFVAIFFSNGIQWGEDEPVAAISVTLIPDIPRAAPPPPKPVPKLEPKVEDKKAADIIRDKKKEEERKKAEEKRKKDEKRRKADEKRKKDEKQKKVEEERKEKEAEQKKRDEEEKKRLDDEQRAAEVAAEAARNQALQNRLSRLRGQYAGRIRARIKSHLKTPTTVPEDDEIEVRILVRLSPDGNLQDLPIILESSGYSEYDESAQRAVMQSAPLPVPRESWLVSDPNLLAEFTELTLYITPLY